MSTESKSPVIQIQGGLYAVAWTCDSRLETAIQKTGNATHKAMLEGWAPQGGISISTAEVYQFDIPVVMYTVAQALVRAPQ